MFGDLTPPIPVSKSKATIFNHLDSFGLGFGLFGTPGAERSGNSFRTLLATLGAKGPNDPCSGQKFSHNLRVFTPKLGIVFAPPSGRNLQGHFESILVNFSRFFPLFLKLQSISVSF